MFVVSSGTIQLNGPTLVHITRRRTSIRVIDCVTVGAPPTCVAHELSRDLLVAAAAAEDLTAESAVVATSESGELLIAVVALLALAVRHPVLLKITVLCGGNDAKPTASQTSGCHNFCFSIHTKFIAAQSCH